MTVLEIWNFLRNLWRAKNLRGLCELAKNLKPGIWRKKMDAAIVNAAMPFIDSADKARWLALSFTYPNAIGREMVVKEFAKREGDRKISLDDCIILKTLIVLGHPFWREAYEAVAEITRPLLKLEGDENLIILMKLGCLTVFLPERERDLLESDIVDAALELLPNAHAAYKFAIQVNDNPALSNDLLVAYAISGRLQFLESMVLLLSGLQDEPLAWLAAYTIVQASLPLLEDEEVQFNDLAKLAQYLQDPKGDGSGSAQVEDALIAAAIPLSVSTTRAASLAASIRTNSGKHRFLMAYAAAREIPTEIDVAALLQEVRSMNFFGREAIDAILSKAAESIPGLDRENWEEKMTKFLKPRARQEIVVGPGFVVELE